MYKMGCIEDTAVSENSIDTLKNLVHRIKISSEIERGRQMAQLQRYEQLLLAEFSKPIKTRSCQLQHSMIENNLTFYATALILLMLENHAKILLQHKTYFESAELLQKVKNSLNVLLYCSTVLGKEDLHHFAEVFRKTYPDFPFPSDNEMDPFVREFKINRKVSFQRQKEYIFQFCNKHNVSAQSINQAGHSYTYK